MRLSKVRVWNFKSIRDTGDLYFTGGDFITILAGQNESGKTALFKALKFFEEGAYSGFEDDLRLGDDCFPRVLVTFMLEKHEYEQLKELTNKKVADYFKQNGFSWVRGNTTAPDYEAIKYITFDEDIKQTLTNLTVDEESTESSDENSPTETFDIVDFFDSIRPKFIYYSSDLEKNILPDQITIDEIGSNQAVLDFQKVYDVDFVSQFADSVNNQRRLKKAGEIAEKASDSLNTYWHQKIDNEKAEYQYSIQMIKATGAGSNSTIYFYVDQGNNMPLKMSQKSQGFRWFSGFILRLRAHNTDYQAGKVILLIDEPGQGLHETAQKDVLNVIEEINRDSGMQILYSTHQPILLGGEKIKFSRLLLVSKNKIGDSVFKTISQAIDSKCVKDALSPVRSALGLASVNIPVQTNRTIVVEGMSDYMILSIFLDSDICIIPSLGADQLPNIFSILYGWGVQPKAILDGDSKGKSVYGKMKKAFFSTDSDADRVIHVIHDGMELEDLIHKDDICKILNDYGKNYDDGKTKVKNITDSIGKIIFAKAFHDKFSGNLNSLNKETKKNFEKIRDWLNHTTVDEDNSNQ